MTVVYLTPQAQTDLERLEAFLSDLPDPQASAIIDALLQALAVLTHQPGIGRPAEAGLRELIISHGHSGYLAKYRYQRELDRVLVLRIRHQRESGYHAEDL